MKKLIIITAILVITSCQKEYKIKERSISSEVSTNRLNDPLIEEMLTSSESVDEFLSKVKNNQETSFYTSNFVPIWNSSSLQQSFNFCPRVLMFNEDASFIFSFTDCPYYTSERDDIEIVQWNKFKSEYELFSVHFRLNGKKVTETYDSYDKKNKEVKIGEENPAECLRCHRGGIAIGAFDPFFFGDKYPEDWMESMTFLKDKISKKKYFEKSNGFKINIPRYGSFLQVENNFSQYPTKEEYHNKALSRYEQPIHRFNTMLADRNHIRSVKTMKDEANNKLGTGGWDKIKYSTLAALSGCENYAKMANQNNKLFPPITMEDIDKKIKSSGYKSLTSQEKQAEAVFWGGLKNFSTGERAEQEEHTDIDIGILKRVGYNRLFIDMMETNDPLEKVYKNRQMFNIANFYHSWYTFWTDNADMRQSVLQINLNTIKFSMHPAWGVANLAYQIILEDEDFKTLLKTGDFNTRDYLNIMSGIKDFRVFSNKDKVKTSKAFSYNDKEAEFKDVLYSGGLKNKENHKGFTSYCKEIERLFNEVN